MGRGTRTKRIEIALNFFLSSTHHHKYCWPADYYYWPSIFLANTYRHTFRAAHVQRRITEHPIWEATERGTFRKTVTGFESQIHIKCCFFVLQVFTLCPMKCILPPAETKKSRAPSQDISQGGIWWEGMQAWTRACLEAPRESLGLLLWEDQVNPEESERCEGLDSKTRKEGVRPGAHHKTVAGS